jgi:hypothetical protein
MLAPHFIKFVDAATSCRHQLNNINFQYYAPTFFSILCITHTPPPNTQIEYDVMLARAIASFPDSLGF